MRATEFLKPLSFGYRNLFYFLAAIFALSLISTIACYFINPWPVFSWQQLQELQTQELPLYAFERGGLAFTLNGENYLLFERWLGNAISPNLIALDVYFIFFGLAFAAILVVASALPRFWFYIGATLAAFVTALLRWNSLLLGGLDSNIAGVAIVAVVLGLLSYFQFFSVATPLQRRYFAFVFLTVAIAVIVQYTASVQEPLRLLAINTLPASIVLFVVFLIVVSHQILASFIPLAMSSSRTHSLGQFLIISTIYLLNLWLTYLSRIGWMDWDYTIPPLLLFVVSAVLTVWTIRQRTALYESILKSDVLLIYFMLGFGTMALATVSYFLSAANDIVILSFNDLILYAHIGYGMMFLVYIGTNFLGMFEKNLPITKVLYKPTFMPYFSYRFAGLIFTLAFVLYNNWSTHLNHFSSGYYTALGDLYYEENSIHALTYFKRAHVYSPYNQHAATALASLERAAENYQKEKRYSMDANLYKATEFTILNTDNLYVIAGDAYQDIQVLRKGKALHPGSGVIKNNLGIAFSRSGKADSARYYFIEAQKDRRTRNSAAMNLLGLLAKSGIANDPDSVAKIAASGSPAVRSNAIALANQQGIVLDTHVSLPADSVLDLFSASLIANFLTNQTNKIDTAFLSACIKIARKQENAAFRHTILQSASKASYASGQVNRSFSLLQEIIFSTNNQGPNNYALGLMALDQGKPNLAIDYFLNALNHNSSPAALAIAVSLAEAGKINEAIVAWDTISQRKDTTLHILAESMKRVLAAPSSWFNDLSEKEKMFYALYRIPLQDSVRFNKLIIQIKDEDLRAKAFLSRSRKYFDADEISLALNQYNHLQGLHLKDTELFAEIKYFELHLLAARHRVSEIEAIIQQGIIFGPYHETDRVYFEAVQAEAKGQTAEAARRYLWLAQNNWLFDEGIVAAASFFRSDTQKSYRILAEALQVNPQSVKILKAYIPLAIARGFDQYAVGALETLRNILPGEAFTRYVQENQLNGLLTQ